MIEYFDKSDQTPELCEIAVKTYPDVIRIISEQSETICEIAIRHNTLLINYVRNQTPNLCYLAIRSTPKILKYIENPTPDMCLEAVRLDGSTLEYVENQTEEMCYEAVRNCPEAIEHIKNQTEELCLMAVRKDGSLIRFIEEQTEEICLEAIRNDIYAIKYVGIVSEKIINDILMNEYTMSDRIYIRYFFYSLITSTDINNLRVICNESPYLYIRLVQISSYLLYLVPEEQRTEELCRHAISHDPWALLHSKVLTLEMFYELANYGDKEDLMDMIRLFKNDMRKLCRIFVGYFHYTTCLLMYYNEDDLTPEVLTREFKKNPNALRYVKNQTEDICVLGG